MRSEANKAKLESFMAALGERVSSAGRIYITGGGTAILFGWREMSVDIDLKASPEPAGFFEAIAALKETLDLNVELASPDDFLPALPEWEARSIFIGRFGRLDFFHYDPYAQALSKLERGHARDLKDAVALLEHGLIDRKRLWDLFLAIEPQLIRYPSIDPAQLRESVAAFCASTSSAG